MIRSLVVKLTTGVEQPERCSQAFAVCAAALASGVAVSLWLTGEAVWLALPGRAEQFELPHSPPLADLRDVILDTGSITVCAPCALRRDVEAGQLLDRVCVAGAASFVAEILEPDVQALVY